MDCTIRVAKVNGADRLRGNREAGLRLCFRICKLLVFSCGASYIINNLNRCNQNQTSMHLIGIFIIETCVLIRISEQINIKWHYKRSDEGFNRSGCNQ